MSSRLLRAPMSLIKQGLPEILWEKSLSAILQKNFRAGFIIKKRSSLPAIFFDRFYKNIHNLRSKS